MRKWMVFALVIGVDCGLFATAAHAQAAASYGMAASKSAAMTTKAASKIQNSGRKLSESIQTKTRKSLEAAMQENRQKLEEKSREGGGMVHINSEPKGARVAVDGALVGRTPAELKVPEGTHLIKVIRGGYLPWQKRVTVTKQEGLTITPKLESKYKSVITLGAPEPAKQEKGGKEKGTEE